MINYINKNGCVPKYNIVNLTRSMGLPREPSNIMGGWPSIAIMLGARHSQVRKCVLVIMADPN